MFQASFVFGYMTVKNPFSRFRSTSTPSHSIHRPVFSTSSSPHLDRRLLQQVRVRFFPSFKQLSYISRFLSIREKRTIKTAVSFALATFLAAAVFFITTHTTVVPAPGGEYTEGFVGQPKLINPIFSSTNEVDSDISALIYSGLFSYNAERKLIPDLAENYSVSDDRTIYTITLKPQLRWSDNEPLTAQDIVFTFETIQNAETGSPLMTAFQGVKIEKINDRTIRFTLKQPFSPFLHTLTTGIIPEHIWGSVDNPTHFKLAKTNLEPIGSGPWRFDRLIKRDGGGIEAISLVPNPHYYGAQSPYIQKFTFRFFPDQSSIMDALKTKKILATSFPTRFNTSSISNQVALTVPIELPQYTALFFNLDTNPILKDKDTRLALQAAIDKKKIVAEALGGQAKKIDMPILEGMLGYTPQIFETTTTIDEANILLDKNWLRIQPEEYFKIRTEELTKERSLVDEKTKKTTTTPDIDAAILADIQKEMSPTQTFYRRDKKNQPLRITITTVDSPEYQRVADRISKDWQSLGVQTTVKRISRQFFLRNVIKNRDYETVLYGEVVGGDPDPFPFWHSSQVNYPGLNLSIYSNRTLDTLLENARAISDPVERAKLYKNFQEILYKDAPAVFLYTPLYSLLVSSEVKNVTIPPLVLPSDRYKLFAPWYIKTHWKWK